MFSLGVFCCWLSLSLLDATNACFSLIFPSLLQDYSRLFVGYGGRVSNVNHHRLVETWFESYDIFVSWYRSPNIFFSSGSVRLSCEERRGSAEHSNGFSICITHRVGEAGLLNN